MKIEYINFPAVYTDDGQRIEVKDIVGTPRVGSDLIEEEGKCIVQAVSVDTECVNGVCPVR